MENARARVTIEGRVQGVYFRHHTQEMAMRLGLKGWVKNCLSGNVEAVFEGDRGRIDQMIQWCRRGPSQAHVTEIHPVWEDYRGEFNDFAIRY